MYATSRKTDEKVGSAPDKMSANVHTSRPDRYDWRHVSDWVEVGVDRVADSMTKFTAAMMAKAAFLSAALLGGNGALAEDLGNVDAGSALVLPFDASNVSGVIAVEIDGVDVTEFVRVENGQVIIAPGAPLAAGNHQATVYILSGNSYSVAGSYSFQTATNSGDAGTSASLVATHEVGVRSVNDQSEAFANSAGEARLETLDKSVTVWANYLATSREADQIEGKPLNIGEYLIELRQSGKHLDLTGRIGHQTLSYDTVLVNNITRRGLSLEATRPGERFELGLFGLKTTEILGAENILGLSDEDDRMFGGRLAFRPFYNSDIRFAVQSYEGEGAPKLGVLPGLGSGTSVSIDGTAIDGRLRYGAAYARVKWDEDGLNGALPEEEADALLANLDYDVLTGENGRYLTLGIGYERVDDNYYSLANPGLPIGTGKDKIQITADYTTDRLTLFASADTARTTYRFYNPSPVDRVSRVALDGTYLLANPGFLADASLRFGGAYDQQKRLETPPLAPEPEDWDGITFYVGLDKNNDLGGWGVDYTYLREDNKSQPSLDRESHAVSGWFDQSINDRLNLNIRSTLTQFETPATGTYWRREGTLGLGYEIDPARWNLALDMGLTDTEEPGVESGSYVSGVLTWSFNPSADLVFNAGYYKGSYAVESGEDHDAVLGVRLRVRTNVFR